MPTIKKGYKVHVYAGMSYHGVTPLFFVDGTSGTKVLPTTITSKKYIQLLEDCLLPSFHYYMDPNERKPIFQ